MNDLPNFFKDNSESCKYEELIDFFMSWTLRCADIKYHEIGLVNIYSKSILSKLLFDDEKYLDDKVVDDIQVWKQWSNIDLWCDLKINNVKYALIIESKMYSSIGENPLEKYSDIAKKFINEKIAIGEGAVMRFVLLRPDYDHEIKYNEKNFCLERGYVHYNLAQLQELLPNIKTGNQLFDEFWFNW